jgi:hypothetical protein
LTNQDEAAKLAAVERRSGWKTIMSTPASRRVVWEQFEIFGIYQISPSVEPGPLAFNEGRRSLALQTMQALLVECPELYDLMTVENRSRLRTEKAKAEAEKEQDQ